MLGDRWRTSARLALLTGLAVLSGGVVAGSHAVAADAAAGERLAKRLCAECHLVDPVQRRGVPDAPPFAEIARIPNMSAERIVLMVLAPHPPMPELPLTIQQAEDVDAYIRSLAK